MADKYREERPRHAEEEKQDPGVERVAPNGIEPRGKVVGHDAGAGEPCLEIAGRPGHAVIGRHWLGGQAIVGEPHMELGLDGAGPN